MKYNRILFVGGYPNAVKKYFRIFYANLIRQIADMGYECHVVAPVSLTNYRRKIMEIPEKEIDYSAAGNPIHIYHPRYISYSSKNVFSFNTGILSEMAFQKSALNFAKKLDNKFDFVYGHFFLSGGLAAVKIGNMLRIPSFVAYGECDYRSQVIDGYRQLNSNDVRGLTGIISVSSKNTNELSEFEFLKSVPTITAPNSVDMKLFYKRDKNESRRKLGLPKDKFIVGFVGGFIERKGDKRLLAAINSIDDVYLACAGRGDNPPHGDKVLFCQPMQHKNIPIFLNAMDIFCLPTLNECSCNAIIEAASCGLPVISSNLPFNDDFLTEDNSIRINPNSVDDLKNAILKLKENPDYLHKIADKIYRDSQEFSIEKRADKILNFISSVIEN